MQDRKKIVGRHEEQRKINKAYLSKEAKLIVMYGRGKNTCF